MKKEISHLQRSLNIWAIVLIIWAFYRHYFQTDLPLWLDEFIIKPLVFFTPLIYFIRKYEQKPLLQAFGFNGKEWKTDVFLGVFIGSLIFFSGAVANYIESGNLLSQSSVYLAAFPIWYLIIIGAASALSEELISRGFIQKRILDETKQPVRSVLYASFLFFFLRIPMLLTIDGIDGWVILQVMTTDLFLSLAVGTLFVLRRNILLPILVHFFYNVALYLFL